MTAGHGHSHSHESSDQLHLVRRRIDRILIGLVAFIALATTLDIIRLWPHSSELAPIRAVWQEAAGTAPVKVRGVVQSITPVPCEDVGNVDCGAVKVKVSQVYAKKNPVVDKGDIVEFESFSDSSYQFQPGDRVILGTSNPRDPTDYYFETRDHFRPLFLLLGLFVGAVVVLGRWKGVRALIGLVLGLAVVIAFVIPSILAGNNPVEVAIVGAMLILLVNLYLAHGVNSRTTIAILGTASSLAVTAALAAFFARAYGFTGLTSDAVYNLSSATSLDFRGMLLGGIIIGTLGVLDDVTVTQASAVWELRIANPSYTVRELYTAALRIGRDHIASTVNTLVLAYVGISLPLLLIFVLGDQPLALTTNYEDIATEIVRTLCGSIGLVASVPLTTFLAALILSGSRHKSPGQSDATADFGDPQSH